MAVLTLLISVLSLMVACVALWPQLSVRRHDADRRHAELIPQIELCCRRLHGHRAELVVTLTGPDALTGLDTLQVTLDDDHSRTPVTAGSPTQEEIDAQLWGPYRFCGPPGAQRTVSLSGVGMGTTHAWALEATPAPPWVPAEHWRQDYAGAPVIVTLTCHRQGHRPWTLARRVEVQG